MTHSAYHFVIYKMPLIGRRIYFSNVAKNKPGGFKSRKLCHTHRNLRFDLENDIIVRLTRLSPTLSDILHQRAPGGPLRHRHEPERRILPLKKPGRFDCPMARFRFIETFSPPHNRIKGFL